MKNRLALLVSQILAVALLLPAVYAKLTQSDDAVIVFTKLGMEPGGRVLIGILELICIVLLLIPGASVYGAILSLAIMLGAVFAHLTHLGVEGAHSVLFAKSCVVAICSLAIICLRRDQVGAVKAMFERE